MYTEYQFYLFHLRRNGALKVEKANLNSGDEKYKFENPHIINKTT